MGGIIEQIGNLNIMKIVRENKTSSAAIAFGLVGVGLTTALVFKKIDVTTFSIALASLGTFASMIIGFLAADAKNKNISNDK